MADLVSLKMSPEDRKQQSESLVTAEKDGPEYPYGLSLHLDGATIEKLKAGDLDVGGTVMLAAKATVTSKGMHQSEGQPKHANMILQLTDMALSPEAASRDQAQALFGSDDDN